MTECPRCGDEMDHNSTSGRDHKGRDVAVSWDECPTCATLIDDMGDVITPRERAEAEYEATKIARETARDQ